MHRLCQTCLLLAFCVLFASLSQASEQDTKADDPKSNNKGKIIGKWKLTEPTGKTQQAKEDFERLTKLGLFTYMEFRPDNVFALGIGAENPEFLDRIKKSAPNQKFTFEAKYHLLLDDTVEIYDVKDEELKVFFKRDRHKADITHKKDKADNEVISIKDPNGTILTLVKVKDNKPEKK